MERVARSGRGEQGTTRESDGKIEVTANVRDNGITSPRGLHELSEDSRVECEDVEDLGQRANDAEERPVCDMWGMVRKIVLTGQWETGRAMKQVHPLQPPILRVR